jgi:hypothetical protein
MGALFFSHLGKSPLATYVWVGLTALVPVLINVRSLTAQLLSRGLLWMNLLLGLLWAVIQPHGIAGQTGLLALLAAGAALLMLSNSGLDLQQQDPKGGGFAPVAFQAALVSIVVMAMADTCSLLFWAGVVAEFSRVSRELPVLFFFAIAGVSMLVTVIGLMRLKTWAFLLNLIANVVIASLVWLFKMPTEMRLLFATTAVGQLIAGAPVLIAIVRGGTTAQPMNVGRFRIVGSIIIVAIMASATAWVFYRMSIGSGGCIH